MSEEANDTQIEPVTETTDPVEPVAQTPVEPQRTEVGQVTPRQEVVFETDELDKRFSSVRQAIESDEMLTPVEKQMKLLEVDTRQEERRDRIKRDKQASIDAARTNYATQYKVTPQAVDATWNEAVAESMRRRGRYDHGTAMTIFEDRLATKSAPAPKDPTPIVEKKDAGQTRTTPRGVRQAPAVPEKKMTVREIMARAASGELDHIPKEVLAEAKM